MNGWLLDTNVLSELRRQKPEKEVLNFIAEKSLESLFVSAISLAEIRFGIEMVTDVQNRELLTEWLTHRVRPMFEGRVLPVSEDVMFRWRVLVEEGRKIGHTFSQPDLMIAATALDHGLTMVTRNTSDFERTNALLINPWKLEGKSKRA